MKEMKKKIAEIVDIAKECPENMQVACFEILLKDYLNSFAGSKNENKVSSVKQEEVVESKENQNKNENQDDIQDSDIHVKAKKFMQKHSVSLEQINQILYKEGDEFKSLYDDLKSTKLSESQVRISLLQCLHAGLKTGEFECSVADVRFEAEQRKCLDKANFSANFKNNSGFYDFNKYDKNTKKLRLSEKGKEELSSVITELQ